MTSKRIAKKAAKELRKGKTYSEREVAGSALSQARKKPRKKSARKATRRIGRR